MSQAQVEVYFAQRSVKSKIIIHVNQHHLKANAKNGTNLPVFTIKIAGRTLYAWSVLKTGMSCLEPHISDPLACGARAYDTTYDPILMLDQDNKVFEGLTFTQAQEMFGGDFHDATLVCPTAVAA